MNEKTKRLETELRMAEGKERVDVLNELAALCNNPQKSNIYVQEALQLAQMINFPLGMAKSHNLIGVSYSIQGDYEMAMEHYQRAQVLYESQRHQKDLAGVLQNIGLVYRNRSDYPQALEYFYQALKINEEFEHQWGIASAHNCIGNTLWAQGINDEALDHHFQALQIQEKLKRNDDIASTYNSIGLILWQNEEYDQALKYYQYALAIFQDQKNQLHASLVGCNIALIYKEKKAYQEALKTFFQILPVFEEIQGHHYLATSYHHIGGVYEEQGSYEEALNYQKKALSFFKRIDDKLGIVTCYTHMGMCYSNLNQIDVGIEYLQQAVVLAGEIGVKPHQKDAHYKLSKLYERNGDFEQALKHYQQCAYLKEELFNEEKSKQIAEMQAKYETEHFKKHNANLEKEINERKKAEKIITEQYQKIRHQNRKLTHLALNAGINEEKLEKANQDLAEAIAHLKELHQEKDEFLGIAAHDLKNPLTAIITSIELLIRFRHKMSETDIVKQLESIRTTSKRMKTIISNLLDINRIESGKLKLVNEWINVVALFDRLLENYQPQLIAKNLHLNYQTSEQVLHLMGDECALYEVFENLFSNAVKFTKPNKHIYVRLTRNDNKIRCEIQDEGQGLTHNDKQKLFQKFARLSSRPTGGEHSTGLGLSIVKRLVEAMNGKIWAESDGKDQGCTFIVEFPL